MGRFFNENLKHAKTWNRRGMETLRQDLNERRRKKSPRLLMEQPETGGLNAPKHAGGRPRLDIAVDEVLDSLSKGNTVAQTAKMMGISRQAVYRAIHSSSTGTLKQERKN